MEFEPQNCPDPVTPMFENTGVTVVQKMDLSFPDAAKLVVVSYESDHVTPQGLEAVDVLKAKAYKVEMPCSTH